MGGSGHTTEGRLRPALVGHHAGIAGRGPAPYPCAAAHYPSPRNRHPDDRACGKRCRGRRSLRRYRPPEACCLMWGTVLLLGLWASFDPARLGIGVLLISRPPPVHNLFAYWLGGMTVGIARSRRIRSRYADRVPRSVTVNTAHLACQSRIPALPGQHQF
jgi:hypothetical protein